MMGQNNAAAFSSLSSPFLILIILPHHSARSASDVNP